jgi:hypothetical protein
MAIVDETGGRRRWARTAAALPGHRAGRDSNAKTAPFAAIEVTPLRPGEPQVDRECAKQRPSPTIPSAGARSGRWAVDVDLRSSLCSPV